MDNVTKKRNQALSNFDSEKFFTIKEASSIVKKITSVNFDATVDMSIRLGVDPKQSNEMVRGVVSLPHGTGKTSLAVLFAQKLNYPYLYVDCYEESWDEIYSRVTVFQESLSLTHPHISN